MENNLWCPKCGHEGLRLKGQDEGQQRYKCYPKDGGCGWHGIGALHPPYVPADWDTMGDGTYLITAAQNATPVFEPGWKNLKHAAEVLGAKIIVIPYRYKNPTSIWSKEAEHDDWWASEVRPYIIESRFQLNDNLVVLADIKTQPTAESPLSGFETITGARSAIVGHPRLELTTVATPQNRLPKILTTTGAITQRNYIESKAGKKGEFHHTFGACLVEVRGDKFFMRQINMLGDGSFMDLNLEFKDGKHAPAVGDSALVMGDTHVDFVDPTVVEATWGAKGIDTVLKPKYVVWHDLNDSYARNHHESKQVIGNYVKHHTGRDNVKEELERAFEFVNTHTRPDQINVLVHSNHPNDHLTRWINETDPREDPENCVFWAQTFQAMCKASSMTERGWSTIDPFAYWGQQMLSRPWQSVFLGSDESFVLHGIELGYHGHHGPNGSRGNKKSFTKIGAKTVSGHIHSPGIIGGSYFAGTSTYLKLGYTHGPSSWMHCHVYVYPNGKRTLLFMIEGEWRA